MSADRLAPPVPSAEAEALDRHDRLRPAARPARPADEFRTTVYLADIEGYPYREIAEIMGTPVGTVMSRLHRGRRKIREQLADTWSATLTGCQGLGAPAFGTPASSNHKALTAITARGSAVSALPANSNHRSLTPATGL